MLNLDTHILVDFVRGELTESEKGLVFKEKIAISDIVLWEISKLISLKRLSFDLYDSQFIRLLRMIQIFPITIEIAQTSCVLDFRSDPADEIIAATSIVYKTPLLTRDKKIMKSKITPLVT